MGSCPARGPKTTWLDSVTFGRAVVRKHWSVTLKAVLGWLGRTAVCLLGSAPLSGVASSGTDFGEGHTVCDDEAWVGIPRSGDGEAG